MGRLSGALQRTGVAGPSLSCLLWQEVGLQPLEGGKNSALGPVAEPQTPESSLRKCPSLEGGDP